MAGSNCTSFVPNILHYVLTVSFVRRLQAGHLPFVDVVRIREGKASAVNILDGDESEDVSARAKGFLSIVKDFQDKVSSSSWSSMALNRGALRRNMQ